MIITSPSNEQIKNIINLRQRSGYRRERQQFIAEGIKMFREIPENDLVKVYISETFHRNNEELFSCKNDKRLFCGTGFQLVSDNVYKKISDTVTPQGVLCIVRQRQDKLEDVIRGAESDAHMSGIDVSNTALSEKNKLRFVVLDRIQDPGNLGTIIRTAEGAGITAVIAGNDTVDRYNPKVIRSTMGSIYRVPYIIADDLPAMLDNLRIRGVVIYAAHLKGTEYYNDTKYADRAAVMIGNESKGLCGEVMRKADNLIKIPMCGKVESLNAAVAAALLMYAMR